MSRKYVRDMAREWIQADAPVPYYETINVEEDLKIGSGALLSLAMNIPKRRATAIVKKSMALLILLFLANLAQAILMC